MISDIMRVNMIYKTLVKVFTISLIQVVLPGDLFSTQEHMTLIRSLGTIILRISMSQSNPICRRQHQNPVAYYRSRYSGNGGQIISVRVARAAGFITARETVDNAL